jgi:hypothetical protein
MKVAAAAFLVSAGLGAASTGSDAQERRNSEIRGVILAGAERKPVAGVRVSLEGTTLAVVTDARGRFSFPRVAAGSYLIRAEAPGFPPATSTLRLADGERLDLEFLLGAVEGQRLPEVNVSAPQPLSPIPAFAQRMERGRGRFITRAFIEERNPPTLADLFRSVPGIRVECLRNDRGMCQLRLARAGVGCHPAYFMDGIPTEPSVLYHTIPSDVEGIEIYSGPAETPPELDRGSNCGTIAIWTRSAARIPPS